MGRNYNPCAVCGSGTQHDYCDYCLSLTWEEQEQRRADVEADWARRREIRLQSDLERVERGVFLVPQ